MEEVVGFREEAEIIMQKLTRGTKELDVFSIFGMAGLGKTTLARKVYNNPSIVDHFDVHVWCAVSQTYNVRKLFAEILKQTTRGTSRNNEDDDVLADKVRKSLKNRRYLIVLDDMWKVEAWEDLRLSFPNDENGSRVMVTTRIEEVAKQLKHYSDPYSLRFLTKEESWELLKMKVFKGENSCPPDLLEPGLQVSKHCKKLPLVIVLIAGIISKMERQASLWLQVANDLSSHILGEQCMKAIQSSYDHLEEYLKPPLLYIAHILPEDYNISSSNLLELWMAEEFVHNFDSRDEQEEAAKDCLNELVNRSLVMVSRRREKNGTIKYCMLHDVVREFCLEKLSKENYRQHILPYKPYLPSDCSKVSGRSCWYIHKDLLKQRDKADWLDILIKENEPHDQSLEFIIPRVYFLPPSIVMLRHIRVLDLDMMELSSSSLVEALKLTNHLRYLQIHVDGHFDFEWVSHLCHLQVLKVYSRDHIRSSVAPFWKMTKLSHVFICRFSFIWEEKDIENFNNSCGPSVLLDNLKTFGRYVMSMVDMNLQFWNRFPNLEKFKVQIEEEEMEKAVSLFSRQKDNDRLQYLKVFHPYFFQKSCRRRVYFPCLFPFSFKYVYLQTQMPWDDVLPSIASLPNLEHLTLFGTYSFQRTCWDVGDYKFPALKSLKLHFGFKLQEWRCSEETFPVLERLGLICCEDLQEIPRSFADIPTLKLIKLNYCKKGSLEESALNIKEQVEDYTGCDSLQVFITKD